MTAELTSAVSTLTSAVFAELLRKGSIIMARSMFAVFNNPEDIIVKDSEGNEVERMPSEYYGLSPQEITDRALETWVSSGKGRYGWVAYCVSKLGLHHLHMVLESKTEITFTTAKKCFPRAHLEVTYGTKEQVEDYINKRGKYEEKGEIVVCSSQIGEIKGNQGKRNDLSQIERELLLGKKPSEIIGTDLKRQRYAGMIKQAYLAKRERETPVQRSVRVFWHYGQSGSGKSYTFKKLCDLNGREEVYKIERDLSRGRFDEYEGERILFIDELKPNKCDWVDLLNCLDVYFYRPATRYHNSVSLWDEVHITSVYSPRSFWEESFPPSERSKEPFEQLERRIETVVKHWKDKEGRFRTTLGTCFLMPSDEVEEDLPFDQK